MNDDREGTYVTADPQSEIDTLRDELDAARIENTAAFNWRDERIEDLSRTVSALEKTVKVLRDNLRDARDARDAGAAAGETLKTRIEKLEAENRQLDTRYEAIVHSRTWKASSSLRNIVRRVRNAKSKTQ